MPQLYDDAGLCIHPMYSESELLLWSVFSLGVSVLHSVTTGS